MRSYTRVIEITKLFVYELIFLRTCTKKLIGNVRREDDSSWSFTSVDTKILKWSSIAAKWPVNYS
jgi:hypothetical protein